MKIKSQSISGQPETSIVFYALGGHDHDGLNSSLINTQQYSILDFNTGTLGDNPKRRLIQEKNLISLKNFIVSTVNESVLAPAGVKLSSNSITADAIVASTITATELAAEVVLINNIIKSNNFNGTISNTGSISNAGTTGWAITYNGAASFNNVTVRGTIEATAGNVGGWLIAPTVLSSDGSASQLYANGLAKFGSNTYIYPNGHISANTFNSTSGTIGPFEINTSYLGISAAGTFLRSNGAITVNSATEIAVNGNVILGNGTLIVGPTPPSSTGLDATWSATTPYVLSQATYSSKKFKNSIEEIGDELNSDLLLKLKVIQFKYNQDYLPETDQLYDKYVCGLIAEEVYEIYPTAVVVDGEGEPLTVSYVKLISPLIDLVQKLEKRIKILENEISLLNGTSEV